MREIFQIVLDVVFDVLIDQYWRILVGGVLGALGWACVAWAFGWDLGTPWGIATGTGMGLFVGVIWHARAA